MSFVFQHVALKKKQREPEIFFIQLSQVARKLFLEHKGGAIQKKKKMWHISFILHLFCCSCRMKHAPVRSLFSAPKIKE